MAFFLVTGSVDPNVVVNIKNARAAGIPYVDVYLFPCPKCAKSASEQVDEMGMIIYYNLLQTFHFSSDHESVTKMKTQRGVLSIELYLETKQVMINLVKTILMSF